MVTPIRSPGMGSRERRGGKSEIEATILEVGKACPILDEHCPWGWGIRLLSKAAARKQGPTGAIQFDVRFAILPYMSRGLEFAARTSPLGTWH